MKKAVLLILLVSLFLGGCGYGTDVENQAYVIAVGIDKGESFPIKASFVFANPGGENSSEGGGAPSAPKPDIVTVEAPTVFSAIRKLDSIKSKAINLSHTKIVVFSKDIAKKGVKDYLSGFAASRDFRPNTYVCVSESKAEKYLRSVKPVHETYIEKYFDNIMQKVAEDKVNEAYLYYLYYNMTEDFSGSVVPLVGVNKNELPKKEDAPDNKQKDDFDYEVRAGKIIRKGKNPAEVLGSAIFKNDKMIGTLGSFHTDLIRLMGNEFYPRNYSIAYPEKSDYVTIRMDQQERAEVHTEIKNGVAHIKINVPVSIEYVDAGKIENHTKKSEKFCRHLENILEDDAEKLIEKSQKEQNCDILGLGSSLKCHFTDVKEWKKFNWKEKYSKARIKVSFRVVYADFEEAN
ncbi:MAG: Ger(x)C family spore germination protein [Clostridia bacterium]|nr:Ger(x)C family spore germination protein [Clostridia bacterium]